MIGIGVGRQTHTVILMNEGEKTEYVPNDFRGVDRVIRLIDKEGAKEVVFIGNKRWALPFAYSLQKEGVTAYYYPIKTDPKKRGRIGNLAQIFSKIQSSGVPPRLFFQEKEGIASQRLALEYIKITDDLRQLKHYLLDSLVVLFPEVVRARKTSNTLPVPEPQPPDLWTKKMRPVLENPDPWDLEKNGQVPAQVRLLAKRSLGKAIPQKLREQTLENHRRFLQEYDQKFVDKKEKMAEIKRICSEHDLMQKYGDGDIIAVITAFLGWRRWPCWRELRAYCGINVTRVDANGKAHISRVRPHIRQYLWLFAVLTNDGKQIVREYDEWRVWYNTSTEKGQEAIASLPRHKQNDLGAIKKKLIEAGVISRLNNTKRIYAVLKRLWWDGLKNPKVTISE